MAMTNELTRWRQRPDHGDVIKSPRGEFVLWEDYDKLSKEFRLAEEGLANATQELNQRDAYIAKLHAARGSTPLENHIASLDIYEEHEGLRAISPAKVLQIVEENQALRKALNIETRRADAAFEAMDAELSKRSHEPAKDSMTCGCGVAGCNGSGVPPAQSKSGHEPSEHPSICDPEYHDKISTHKCEWCGPGQCFCNK